MATINTQPHVSIVNRHDLQQHVTDTITAQLEAGTVPWHQPWKSGNGLALGLPRNASTGKGYRGINILMLWSATYKHHHQTHEWATFKQWQAQKETIRPGEKGSLIVYYDTLEKEVDGEITEIPFLKSSYVFNRSQLSGFQPQPVDPDRRDIRVIDRLQMVERFVYNTRAIIDDRGEEACYDPDLDKIVLPREELFTGTDACTASEAYYSTNLHELTHWTGHKKRLNRNMGGKFGDKQYAFEELIAELGAAFLCAEFEIGVLSKGTHASYIDTWLQLLKSDKRFIFQTASEASKAVDYLFECQK